MRQRAREPGATRTGGRDEEQGCGLRWPRTDEWIAVTLRRSQGAAGGHLRAVLVGPIRDGKRLLVALHADEA